MTKNYAFAVFIPENAGGFESRATSVYTQLQKEEASREKEDEVLVWARVFLSDITNQLPVIKSSPLGRKLDECAVSYVEQPLLDGSKITIMACFAKHAHVEAPTHDTKRIITPRGTWLFQSVRFSENEIKGLNGKEQTILAFERHKKLLESKGMSVADNTVRTWLYVRDIDSNYMDVVKGRNDFFAKNGLTTDTHFIASTGIGGYTDCAKAVVAVDFLSQENLDADNVKYLHATEHLNPTAEYGVAFERGTALYNDENIVSFISGTASIDKFGNCIHLNDPERQTERLMENIAALLADAESSLDDLQMVIAYLRDPADKETVKAVLKKHLGKVPTVITEARVCRPQWLVEAECITCKSR